jgi:hypothetical protein
MTVRACKTRVEVVTTSTAHACQRGEMEDTSDSHSDDQLGDPIMQVQILSLAHLLYKAC